jgi:nicotinate-nucleotide adenylyltransferase
MKVGLYFGSFNPIHIGHMAIANYFAEFAGLNQVWFVVSPQNPLKNKNSLLPDYQRLEMVRLAIDDDPRFVASNIEFGLPKPSYTVNTLAILSEKFPKISFSLIMGQDNLVSLNKWKNYTFLLENYTIFAYPRPGQAENPYAGHKNVVLTQAPMMELSSSFIRESIARGNNMRFFLPPRTWQYIEEMNFYKT